jgi:hypothetical protein
MRRRFALLLQLSAFVLTPGFALAHGKGEHLLGTVRTAAETSLSMATKDGKVVTVLFDAKTKFESGGARATAKDVLVDQRVVVHARKEAGALVAELVKLGAQKPEPAHPGSTPDAGRAEKTGEKAHHEHSTK